MSQKIATYKVKQLAPSLLIKACNLILRKSKARKLIRPGKTLYKRSSNTAKVQMKKNILSLNWLPQLRARRLLQQMGAIFQISSSQHCRATDTRIVMKWSFKLLQRLKLEKSQVVSQKVRFVMVVSVAHGRTGSALSLALVKRLAGCSTLLLLIRTKLICR